VNDVTLQGVPVEAPHAADMRFVSLIWGSAGSGKTTLASTAPGNKLWLGFDNDGEVSLVDREDVRDVLKLYKLNPLTVVQEFKKADPYNLTRFLTDRPDIKTVVFDSMTTYAYMALQEAVRMAGGNKISMEQPGMQGYSYRNSLVLRAATNLLAITARLGRNVIFVTHEGSPMLNDDGNVESITMVLSENLANQIGLRINEVWHLADADGRSRWISVRPHTRTKPMKTRMFDTSSATRFVWHFNADTMLGEGIADWWHAWQENGGKKLALPSVARATTTKGGVKK
jgi:hypothetical protein